MSGKPVTYISISKLGRGYAGRIIDEMSAAGSVVYIMRNNEPEAVMMPVSDYQEYMKLMNTQTRINKKEISGRLAGSLHKYADSSKISGEEEYYRKGIGEKYGK